MLIQEALKRIQPGKSAIRIGLYYGLFGVTWVLTSDWVVREMAVNPRMLHILQSSKGVVFVVLSVALILLLLKIENRKTIAVMQELDVERRRLAGILEGTRVGTWEWHIPSGRTVFNERWAEVLGYTLEDLSPVSIQTWYELVHPDDLAKSNEMLERHFNGELDYYDVEVRMRHKDGHWVWIQDRGKLISRTTDGQPLLMAGTHTDITRRKQSELEAQRMSRLYATLSQTNQAIIRSTQQEEMFNKVCEVAIQHGGFLLAWIGVPDTDGVVRVIAAKGETRYLDDIRISVNPEYPEGHGPTGLAYQHGVHQVINDFDGDASTHPWHEKARQFGFGASAAFPLIVDNKTFGILNIYARQPGFFQEKEIGLLDEMASNISFGVENYHRSMELSHSEARFLAIAEGISDAIVLANMEREIQWVNPGFTQVFGYQLDDVRGLKTEVIYENPEEYAKQGKLRFNKEAGVQARPYEINYRHKNGTVFVGETIGTVLQNKAGEKLGYIGMIRDITERRHADGELRIAAAAFEVENGIMITSRDLHIERVNRAFSRITGYTAEEVIGKRPGILRSGRHDKEFYREMWHQINIDGFWQGEIWNKKKNGDIYPEWLTISGIRDESGNITHYIGSFTDIAERKEAEQRIHQLAFYDPLTDLANRRLFIDRLEHARLTSERSQQAGALLMLDLDHFKTLNDTQGHHAGDELLIEVSRRLVQHVRDVDTVARLGGDEFVVLLEALNDSHAGTSKIANDVATKIQEVIRQPYKLSNIQNYRITPSIGVTVFNGRNTSVEDLLKQADMALYEAKSAGRNTIQFFNPDMQQRVEQRVTLETAIDRAMQNEEFQLHYQPQMDIQGNIVGAEVLLRWFPADGTPISPSEFIPLAEDTGQIIQLGYWVLETTCQQLQQWQKNSLKSGFSLAVNISARQFHQDDFVRRLEKIIRQTGIKPEMLKLELTESVVLEDIGYIIERIAELGKIGVGISLDDFGTGYSSLSYLQRLPLDQLKIDTAFVRHIVDSPNDAAIVRAIIAMAHSLNLEIVAEGVETIEQKEYLEKYQCDVYQGYFFGRPMPVVEFEKQFLS